ncbi:1,4-dihydroxy-2-naphthoate polyprenyltransferase [Candidatus Palauibacter sp.]|uniref:1,4-dihydroxy-2-naphthoate polyprenyltransferase n=1 Tax=Candidatus Palauibacter sp. TaxID=3101350 RepID=UPI003B528024
MHAWIAGARLRTLPAAMGPVLAGGGLAWKSAGFSPGPFLAALAGALLIQVGTNFSNDYSDFVRGADTADRLGTPRVTQSGLLSPRAVRFGAGVSFALAVGVGAYLVAVGGWPIVWIGVAGILAGICYTGGPWPFGYHGLGDLFTFTFFGPIAVAGTCYVQMGRWPSEAILAGVGAGALVTAILVVNNLRDRATDAAAGKRTLAVRLGRTGTCVEYSLLLVVAAAIPPAGAVAGLWPAGALLACAAVLLAAPALHTVWRHEDPRALNPALAGTARAAGAYGLLFAVGCLL